MRIDCYVVPANSTVNDFHSELIMEFIAPWNATKNPEKSIRFNTVWTYCGYLAGLNCRQRTLPEVVKLNNDGN